MTFEYIKYRHKTNLMKNILFFCFLFPDNTVELYTIELYLFNVNKCIWCQMKQDTKTKWCDLQVAFLSSCFDSLCCFLVCLIGSWINIFSTNHHRTSVYANNLQLFCFFLFKTSTKKYSTTLEVFYIQMVCTYRNDFGEYVCMWIRIKISMM